MAFFCKFSDTVADDSGDKVVREAEKKRKAVVNHPRYRDGIDDTQETLLQLTLEP